MTKQVIDYNPLTGVTTYVEFEASTGKTLVTDIQAVDYILDQTQTMRSDSDYSRQGIKDDLWHYARVPLTVMVEMKDKFGVDMMASKPDWKSIFRVINREYPYLKATDGKHG